MIADDGASAGLVAADLLAQAEHDPLAAAILLTTSPRLAQEVPEAIAAQLEDHPRREVTEASIRISGLAKMLDLDEDERKQYQAFDDLAFATSHIPILADWKRLSSKERYKFTLERETIESKFEARIQHAVIAVDQMLNQR